MTSQAEKQLTACEPYMYNGFSPAKIIEIELTEPMPIVYPSIQHRRMWILARLHSEPVGICITPPSKEGFTPDQLATVLWNKLCGPIVKIFAAAGQAEPSELTRSGLQADRSTWPFLRRRSVILADAPAVSVVVCTRDRPAQLEICMKRLEKQIYPQFEVIVVDNAPTTDAARSLVERRDWCGIRFRYHLESRPGLSRARNAGTAAAKNQIIAFLDDDDEPDKHWLAGIANGFARSKSIGCVTGLVLPARLDTASEELFEQIGGHTKGRNLDAKTYTKAGPQSPLFPLPPFGVGANMAFRREVLASIGGFDVALGAGTRTAAGEDTLAFTLTMLDGYEIAYEPSALMWHHHRQDMESLNRQLHGYSIGLTAYYAALLRHRPRILPKLLKLLPAASSYLANSAIAPSGIAGLSAGLNRRQLQGHAVGPVAYLWSIHKQRSVPVSRPSLFKPSKPPQVFGQSSARSSQISDNSVSDLCANRNADDRPTKNSSYRQG